MLVGWRLDFAASVGPGALERGRRRSATFAVDHPCRERSYEDIVTKRNGSFTHPVKILWSGSHCRGVSWGGTCRELVLLAWSLRFEETQAVRRVG